MYRYIVQCKCVGLYCLDDLATRRVQHVLIQSLLYCIPCAATCTNWVSAVLFSLYCNLYYFGGQCVDNGMVYTHSVHWNVGQCVSMVTVTFDTVHSIPTSSPWVNNQIVAENENATPYLGQSTFKCCYHTSSCWGVLSLHAFSRGGVTAPRRARNDAVCTFDEICGTHNLF